MHRFVPALTGIFVGACLLAGSPLSQAAPRSQDDGLVESDLAADEAIEDEGANEDGEEEPEWDVMVPPGEGQTITIDTDETTWSDVSVSPDGSTFVFDMLGDVYTVPIAGGEATALTSGIEWNMQPRFSPDGSKIAFISDRAGGNNLWVMNADGTDPAAVSEETENPVHSPNWSPDGEFLVAKLGVTGTRSIPGGSIWMYHRAGGDGLELVERLHEEQSQKNIDEPAFSPDGRYVYFSQDTTSGRVWQYNKDSTGEIFVIKRLDRETGEVDVIASGAGGAIRPTPSPDGKYLAFVKRLPGLTSAIYLQDLESGKEWPIYDRFERDLQEVFGIQGNATALSWTPDGDSIVFWSAGGFHRLDVESETVTTIPVHVKADKKIHPALRFPVDVAPAATPIRMLRWAQHSPDGSKVVFQALGHLYVKDLDSGTQTRLTSQTDHFEFYPRFSSDGRWVVYTTWDDQDLGSVRVVSIQGGAGRTLTPKPGHFVEPSFSPDGRHVVYRKITGGFLLSPLWSVEPGIYLAPVAGGNEPRRLVKEGFEAQFGADGGRVFFSSDEDQDVHLKSVDLDGHDERVHVTGKGISEFRLSPDGRWIAFAENYNTFVAPFVDTGKPLSLGSSTKSIPVRQVSKRSGEFLHWSADSSKLHWANGATLFSRELKDAFDFLDGAPDELPEPVAEGLDLGFDVASDAPEGVIALVGGRVVTMRDARSGTQEVFDHGTVVIEGNRIVAVGSGDEVTVPDGAHVLDVSGKTIIPGLIDSHAHGAMARSEITPQQNWAQFSNLSFGVTTVHDPSNDTSSIFSAAELQRAGGTVAPRIFSTGTILYGAHDPGFASQIGSLEDAQFHVQRLKDVGAISVKSYAQPRRDQRQQVIAAARELGIMVVPEGGGNFQNNMNMVGDGHTGIEHALSIVRGYEDVLQWWSQTASGYTPTLGVAYGGLSGEFYWYDRTNVWENARLMRYVPRFMVEPRSIRRPKAPDDHYNHIEVARFAKRLRDRGVSVQLGAHGQREGLAAHWEMWMMHQGGFTPWESLRTGTADAAWYLGMDADLGSIEPGKLADLAVVGGDPLTDIRRSEFVDYTMINGRLYETATMNQIGNDTTTREPFFFELEGGDTIHPATQRWLEEFKSRHGWVH